MKKEVAVKWVEALRSGEYSQTQGTLKDNVGYCCLGVLCSLNEENLRNEGFSVIKRDNELCVDGDDAEFTTEVSAFFDLDAKTETTLIDMNDNVHSNFNEIADYIEKEIINER